MEDKASKVIDGRTVGTIVLTAGSCITRINTQIHSVEGSKNVGLVDTNTCDGIETLAAIHVTLAITDFTVEDVCIYRRDKAVVLTWAKDCTTSILRS